MNHRAVGFAMKASENFVAKSFEEVIKEGSKPGTTVQVVFGSGVPRLGPGWPKNVRVGSSSKLEFASFFVMYNLAFLAPKLTCM